MLASHRLQQRTQSSINSAIKCTRLPICQCLMCHKQLQIFGILAQRQGLQWFGRRKVRSTSSIHVKQVQVQLIKRQKNNKKNESESFDVVKKHLDCFSSYFDNYKKKQLRDTKMCHPENQINLDSQHGNTFKTNYHDSFRLNGLKIQTQKPIKKLQIPTNLPFIGKSSYKQQYAQPSLTQRTNIIKPRDSIKTIHVVDTRNIQKPKINDSMSSKALEIFRPPSPFRSKGHMIKSSSYTFAYNTLYKNSFDREKGAPIIRNEPNPEFLRKSKFGSLGKARWMTSKKLNQMNREHSLQLYK